MKLLVIGGSGYIGSRLVPFLIDRGHEVHVADLMWFGNHLPPEAVLEDPNSLTSEDSFQNYDQVLFLAGLSNDPMANFNPTANMFSNSTFPTQLALYAKRAGVRRFIYASSCSVYAGLSSTIWNEEMAVEPLYPYGISKYSGEKGCFSCQDNDFSVILLRKGTVGGYSPRMRLDLLVNKMFKDAFRDQKIVVENPLIQRPILDIRDACEAYLLAIEADYSIDGAFNIASENVSLQEIADLLKKELESTTDKKISIETRNESIYRNYRVETEKAEKQLGFKPKFFLSDTIKDLLDNVRLFSDWENDTYYNLRIFEKISL
jgi:nucleoside-diphosphate-sugar epimerase